MSKFTNMTPPPDELRDLIYYDDGELYWQHHYRTHHKRSDKPIGYVHKDDGYKKSKFKCGDVLREYAIHRLIYWLHTGDWPEEIDHKDQNKINNYFENLRPATHGQNQQNKGICKNNTSGYVGVKPERGKYTVTFYIDGKQFSIYGYKNKETAALARDLLAYMSYGDFASYNIDKPIKMKFNKEASERARAEFNALIESVKQP